jgi:hypothetical protein
MILYNMYFPVIQNGYQKCLPDEQRGVRIKIIKPCAIISGWSPFPGVEAYPVIISFSTVSDAPQTLKIFLGKK